MAITINGREATSQEVNDIVTCLRAKAEADDKRAAACEAIEHEAVTLEGKMNVKHMANMFCEQAKRERELADAIEE